MYIKFDSWILKYCSPLSLRITTILDDCKSHNLSQHSVQRQKVVNAERQWGTGRWMHVLRIWLSGSNSSHPVIDLRLLFSLNPFLHCTVSATHPLTLRKTEQVDCQHLRKQHISPLEGTNKLVQQWWTCLYTGPLSSCHVIITHLQSRPMRLFFW